MLGRPADTVILIVKGRYLVESCAAPLALHSQQLQPRRTLHVESLLPGGVTHESMCTPLFESQLGLSPSEQSRFAVRSYCLPGSRRALKGSSVADLFISNCSVTQRHRCYKYQRNPTSQNNTCGIILTELTYGH